MVNKLIKLGIQILRLHGWRKNLFEALHIDEHLGGENLGLSPYSIEDYLSEVHTHKSSIAFIRENS